RPAEREALQLAARELPGADGPRLPEAKPLEQHADPLAALGHAVEPPVEVEILEHRQLAVHERLVAEESDRAALGLDLERPAGRHGQARAEAQQGCLPRPVRARDDEEAAALELEVQPAQDALLPVVLLEPDRPDHRTSSSTQTKNATEMTPFIVKKAVSSRRRSPGRTSECS